jgi:hypothetical protein
MHDPTTATVSPRLVIVMDYPRVCGSGGATVLTGWDHDTDIEFPSPHDKAFRFIAVYGEGIYEITHEEARRCLQAWEMGDEDSPVVPMAMEDEGHSPGDLSKLRPIEPGDTVLVRMKGGGWLPLDVSEDGDEQMVLSIALSTGDQIPVLIPRAAIVRLPDQE